MSDEVPFESDSESEQASSAIDNDVLERIGHYLAETSRFSGVEFRPEHAPDSVVAEYDLGYFPSAIERRRWVSVQQGTARRSTA